MPNAPLFDILCYLSIKGDYNTKLQPVRSTLCTQVWWRSDSNGVFVQLLLHGATSLAHCQVVSSLRQF